ncbi:hypothetical protein BKA70DRAFT_1246226 [Coprinopsis sp. MPI-PUGE-AT-0042]|nr:hypothetical protein BKA70DRAFT_1246226 [Coprinopsis sp. MPI-PUGE-AT-0042]
MRAARPSLVLTDAPSYSSPFHADPWPVHCDGGSPASELSGSDCSFHHSSQSEASTSNRSSRTSSTHSHVIPESTFLTRGKDGQERYLVDPYFGNKDIALLASSFLSKSFGSKDETETSIRLGQPSLSVFVAQIIHLTGVPTKVVFAALILLHRLQERISSERRDVDCASMCMSGHRLFMAGLMLACNDENVKGLCLDAKSAAYWSEISLFPEQELDDAFNDLYDQLEGNTVVFPSYAAYLEKLNNPVSIKSFEGDLDFFTSDDLELLDEDEDPSRLPSTEVLPETKAVSTVKRKAECEAVKLAPPRMSVRTKISSLFGRRAKSPKLDD